MNFIPNFESNKVIQDIVTARLEGKHLSSFFRYAKIKGNVLFFVFNNPTIKKEFEYKKEDIKTKMRGYYSAHKEALKANNVVFNDIVFVFIAEPKVEKPKRAAPLIYVERSKGIFDTACSDPRLIVIFEEIKQTIQGRKNDI